jgi:hypothetical protein
MTGMLMDLLVAPEVTVTVAVDAAQRGGGRCWPSRVMT